MTGQDVTTEGKKKGQNERQPERQVELSVIVPISERYDDLRELYVQFSKELEKCGKSFEFIFILDGPQVGTAQILKDLRKEHPRIFVYQLNRSFGEATALSVGFEKAQGSLIVTLSPYFQVEPHEIHKLLQKVIDERYDLVISWRHPRIDSALNRLQGRIFNGVVRFLTGSAYHDISCGLRVMKRKVAEEVQLYGDLHRFLPLLVYRQGFKVAEIPVQQSLEDRKRRVQRPGVYLRRLLDILTLFFLVKFTKKPLRFFGLVGSGFLGTGTVITGYLGIYRILGFGGIADRPLLILGVLLIVLGVQLFSIGLLGEIIIFTHARREKDYFIGEILD